jgi:hypothetical protein
MKIDVHAHLFSLAYIQSLQRIFGNDSTPVGQDAQRLIRWMSSDPRMIDVEDRLEEMTKWDIDIADPLGAIPRRPGPGWGGGRRAGTTGQRSRSV